MLGLKSKLTAREVPLLGAFIGISSPPLIEMLGYGGYDFVILDSEHGAFNPEGLEGCLRAARAVGVPCMVRVAELEAKSIQSALDLGSSGVQIPQIETAHQANMGVQASRFPPLGGRGWGSTTAAAAYGFRSRPHTLEMARQEIIVCVQIESRAGVENLPDILKVDGIDVVFIGTSDLSLDYGYESPNDPRMAMLTERMIAEIDAAGKVPGIHISDWTKIEQLQALGARYLTVSAGLVIRDAIANQVKDFSIRTKRGK